jgi:SAM-dependent methyltransferase
LSNRLRLGVKKTVEKITQPINSCTRFPEYYWFETAIREHLRTFPTGYRPKIFDVGSPKMLGLYLGLSTPVEVILSDISELNVDEYRTIWHALEGNALGRVSFSLQDARSLQFRDAEFDVVYSMSVIEHIEGDAGDSQSIHELVRVLKPGGLLVFSIPFRRYYVEQKRIGFSGAVRKTDDRKMYFFQRIYDQPTFEERILHHASELKDVTVITVCRNNQWLLRTFNSLGRRARCLESSIHCYRQP